MDRIYDSRDSYDVTWQKRDKQGNAYLDGPLYHYTSVEALHGIVESGSFRATNVFYMSDESEIEYGLSCIRSAAKRTAATGKEAEIIPHLIQWLN